MPVLKTALQDPKYLEECSPHSAFVYTRLPAKSLKDLHIISRPAGSRHQPPSRPWESAFLELWTAVGSQPNTMCQVMENMWRMGSGLPNSQ